MKIESSSPINKTRLNGFKLVLSTKKYFIAALDYSMSNSLHAGFHHFMFLQCRYLNQLKTDQTIS
jgi:hypothetical protein